MAAASRDRTASVPAHLDPSGLPLAVVEHRPAPIVHPARVRPGGGDRDGVTRTERVHPTLPRLPLNGGAAAHLAERGRELLERPQQLDEGPRSADIVPGQPPPSRSAEEGARRVGRSSRRRRDAYDSDPARHRGELVGRWRTFERRCRPIDLRVPCAHTCLHIFGVCSGQPKISKTDEAASDYRYRWVAPGPVGTTISAGTNEMTRSCSSGQRSTRTLENDLGKPA